ncbi:MAG: nucleophile aminohydrolase [Monoraphidium minutum]|nr:MAG: nucleophile aminohydrolase [Monoraphidium minutum]
MAYIGHPMLVADVVLWPDRSIIKQSYDARERLQDPSLPFHLGFGNLNGDGFGIGWFNTEERREQDPSPCMFKSITPAWNNENLARLSTKIVSPVIFAHVRAAYPGMPVSEQNCHPFQFGRYLWMHNGVVGGFNCIRRHLLSELSDAAYNTVQSFHSDSAVSFSLFLNHLPDTCSHQPPDDTIATICRVQRERGVSDTSLLNFVVSDGTTMVATRFVSPEGGAAATLYYAEGCGGLALRAVLREASYSLAYGARGSGVAFIASEPITGSNTDWVSVPKNTALVITREKGGYINIMRAPLAAAPPPAGAADPWQLEVATCLEVGLTHTHTRTHAHTHTRGLRASAQYVFLRPGPLRSPHQSAPSRRRARPPGGHPRHRDARPRVGC